MESIPNNKAEKTDFISSFLKKLPFLIVGILIGIIVVILYQGHLTTITNYLYNMVLVVFGAMVLTFVLVFGFREYLTHFVFGKKIEKAGDLIDDAKHTSTILIDRLTDQFLTDTDLKDKVKTLTPRFANWFIWGRLRNWWWQWLVGIATFLVGLVGTLLLINQNVLLNNQNKLIEHQMSLEEASRRSSLVVLMSNIMDKVDDEINRQLKTTDTENTRYRLSASLIGQIAALSHSFKPYRYMDGDTLITNPLSPERGHLLITLTRLPLDKVTFDKIFKTATFALSDLQNVRLDSTYLVRANLNCANLNHADLRGADLRGADLAFASLRFANAIGADLSQVDLNAADLSGQELNKGRDFYAGANLSDANLSEANLSWANIKMTNFSGANMSMANLDDADLYNADLSKTDMGGLKISIKQTNKVISLYNCKNLHDTIKISILKTHPQLFEKSLSDYH
jgi:uncharacterized protein YjbI with pentapeptide repeats